MPAPKCKRKIKKAWFAPAYIPTALWPPIFVEVVGE